MIGLPSEIAEAMIHHAEFEHPNEACGLVAGVRDAIRFFYPLANVAAAPDRYTIDPAGHIKALLHAEACGWQLIGAFHSHPLGPALPSPVDLAEALEPEWIHLILGTDGLRAWRLDGAPREIPIERPLR